MTDLTTELSMSDSQGLISDIMRKLNLNAEFDLNTAEYICPMTNREYTAIESVSVAITGNKPGWATQTDWMVFKCFWTRLIQDDINQGVDAQGKSNLDNLEKTLREAA